MKLVKEIITKQYNEDSTIEEKIEQYYYDSEEEKIEHKDYMESNGWEDSGQVRKMIGGSLMSGGMEPVYTWFGSYCKWEVV